jgi:uncharacterized protein (DUF1810 family)
MTSALSRFTEAQQDSYADALAELRAGRKRSHWMWFVFPQLRGLGHSETAHYYGIADLAEAAAYLGHPVLGPRLVECTQAVLALGNTTLNDLFGHPDELKFISSMTLFSQVPGAPAAFGQALARFNQGRPDPATLQRLAR